jgi:tetratricopeptide (TPR) repeat protein
LKRKKTLLKFCRSIVLFFFSIAVFFITSCSNQEETVLRYKIEKNLYNSERLKQVLFINLKAASPDDFKKVMDSYQQVVNLASQAKAPLEREIQDLAASAQLRIAELYLRQRNPDSALSVLQLILNNYPQSQSQNKNAFLGIAKIYEGKREKEKAIQTYHQLLESYPPLIPTI